MDYWRVSAVIRYIHGEMTTNIFSGDALAIRDWLNVDLWDTFVPILEGKKAYDIARAYKKWYYLVKSGGDWDHKPYIKEHFGENAIDEPNKRLYNFDIWSNMHYGYVGKAVGFPEDILKAGAGVAQAKDGTSKGNPLKKIDGIGVLPLIAALDDPWDQEAIKVGFELWDTQKTDLSPDDILNMVRQRSGRLNTEPVPA